MKVLLFERVEVELAHYFAYGVEKFGHQAASRTFVRVRRFLFQALASYPHLGTYYRDKNVYEVVIPRTPFVVFYRVDPASDALTAVAFFHHAQDRDTGWDVS
jgi:plasmid stabilization system protein ParE